MSGAARRFRRRGHPVARPPDNLEEAAVRKCFRDTGGTTMSVLGINTRARFIELGNANGESITYHWHTSGKRVRLFPLDRAEPAAPDAPKPVAIGSEHWALSWRADMQYTLERIPGPFIEFARRWEVGEEHEVWRLLNKPDGTYFESFDEFCLEKEPWGLGATPDEVEKWLEVGRTEQLLQLAQGRDGDERAALAAEIESAE